MSDLAHTLTSHLHFHPYHHLKEHLFQQPCTSQPLKVTGAGAGAGAGAGVAVGAEVGHVALTVQGAILIGTPGMGI